MDLEDSDDSTPRRVSGAFFCATRLSVHHRPCTLATLTGEAVQLLTDAACTFRHPA
jgi:hypothetical protein